MHLRLKLSYPLQASICHRTVIKIWTNFTLCQPSSRTVIIFKNCHPFINLKKNSDCLGTVIKMSCSGKIQDCHLHHQPLRNVISPSTSQTLVEFLQSTSREHTPSSWNSGLFKLHETQNPILETLDVFYKSWIVTKTWDWSSRAATKIIKIKPQKKGLLLWSSALRLPL